MVTQICTLKFADGHVITATVTAASPTGNETIKEKWLRVPRQFALTYTLPENCELADDLL